MEQRTVTHDTFTIERSYPAAPERVFAAFADPVKKRRWFVDGKGSEALSHEIDFRVGGVERAQVSAVGGPQGVKVTFTNDTSYQDIVPNRRIVIAYTMSMGDQRISASLATIELLRTAKGTDLIFTEQGAFFEGADGVQMREAGWRQLLGQLETGLAA